MVEDLDHDLEDLHLQREAVPVQLVDQHVEDVAEYRHVVALVEAVGQLEVGVHFLGERGLR